MHIHSNIFRLFFSKGKNIFKMNLMRKLRGTSTMGGSEPPESTSGSSPHTQLGLMHLKKLFSEYSHPPHPLTDVERDDKLYNMLPLFYKVCLLVCFLNMGRCFFL